VPSLTAQDINADDAQQAQFEAEAREIVNEHRSSPAVVTYTVYNEGWGERTLADTRRVGQDIKNLDPSRLVNAHSGVNCCNSHGDSGAGDVIDFHQYLGPASPAPSGNRVAIDGEHGGFGLKTSNHMWFGDGQAYEMEPDSPTLTAKYVANQEAVITSAKYCGISAAIYTRMTRSQMLEVLDENYVRTARAKGVTERRVVTRHALRNALLPVVTLFGLDLGQLLGGAVITEKIFSMQGLGSLLIDAVGNLDLPVVLGVTLFSAFLIVVANLLVDLTYSRLDPRVSRSG